MAELYHWPFHRALVKQYRTRELFEMHALLAEKGLRIRVELDDFVDASYESETEKDQDEDEDMKEVRDAEEIIAERRALMPY